MNLSWYRKRLAAMSAGEVKNRLEDATRRRLWVARSPTAPTPLPSSARYFEPPSPNLAPYLPSIEASNLVKEADLLLTGKWKILGLDRTDVTKNVDYYADPRTGKVAPAAEHAFTIDHRNEQKIGNIKNIWELGRHQHLTVLAAAYAVTKYDRYAHRIKAELNHFFDTAPFCLGVHWISGIELGLRLISWVWIRRLLHGWDRAADLFENNSIFVDHIGRHHQWLDTFPAHGSSANNHLIAESCGVFIASSAFSLFDRTEEWKQSAARTIAAETRKQTFDDGLNRELASDYHGFVTELITAAYVEARSTGHPLADELQPWLISSYDALAAICDVDSAPHNQGDADDGHGLLLDPPSYNRWHSLLSTGDALFGALHWWPSAPIGDIRTAIFESSVGRTEPDSTNSPYLRPTQKPNHFASAGQTILRTHSSDKPELWTRFDHGPHGYLSTAAHAHADALSIEVRVAGTPILVDPGTYCYHGEPQWRDYFRSTLAHSTVELDGKNQSEIEGPFLWSNHCATKLHEIYGLDSGNVARCEASHSGYQNRLGLIHARTVELIRDERKISITDRFSGPPSSSTVDAAVAFHFHPDLAIQPADSTHNFIVVKDPTNITTQDPDSTSDLVKLSADQNLNWSLSKGKTEPPLGWYSHSLGHREPAWVLVGRGTIKAGSYFTTTLRF